MKFQKLSNQNQNQLKKKTKIFEKSVKRLLFMRNVCERVNKACKFERIKIK